LTNPLAYYATELIMAKKCLQYRPQKVDYLQSIFNERKSNLLV
jgi:hypothetical protein